ncbi:MAG: ATP-binding cassette domain-containing protein [Desulfobulbaceae bacterium]|nr:ATP-binding cassette domain-containing protein [Desulfobulbaceae bacterium]HIJ77871.1 ABC-F family ATP-binding cassette domain-containing protein [Deltaproteobacteria bacterium]
MLSINHLSIQFGEKHLFKDVSVRVHPQDRIGLAGVNGAGKSTLLKIMTGIIKEDDGVVTRSKNTTIGYLPQEITAITPGNTLYQEAETAFADALAIQEELDRVNHLLGDVDPEAPGFDDLLAKQGDLQHRLDQTDIFRMQSQIETILLGLGFSNADFSKDCQSFSGGWLMRLMLAKLLLANPALLLLDEPTNHLDIESLTWFEEFLKNYQGSIIMISHDRAFLDNLTTTTWELSLGELTVYKGNYSKYLIDKEERMQIKRAAYENQQARIQQTMRFVDRFRSKSTKASQVQSKLKQLDKMELIELDETERTVSFKFPPSPPSGRLAIEVTGLCKEFNKKEVFKNLSFSLQRGEKIAVVGKNGAGKSTLVKILAGLIQPDSGKITVGHNVKVSYFGQHQAQELDPNYTILETLSHVSNEMTIAQTRSLLGTFLFTGDDVDKKVGVLSGGEKSRVALAKMIASPANLLILDEPTNHLDITSQEVLQEAMRQYDGSIIVVSHNRYFINSFVSKVLEIKNTVATLFDGNIDYYLHKIQENKDNASAAKNSSRAEAVDQPVAVKAKGKEARQQQARLRQLKSKELEPLKKIVTRCEQEIEKLEAAKTSLEQALADPELYNNQDKFTEKNNEYNTVQRQLKRSYQEWENSQAKIEELENRFKKELGE